MATPDRTSKSLADRIDPQFHRRPNPLRRAKWPIGLAGLVLPLAWVGLMHLSGNRTMYQAGPVSIAHQFIAHDCRQCHTTPWQTAARLARLDAERVATPDAACLVCHAGPIHHDNQITRFHHCADCHREHRGHAELSRIDDRFCVACHRDLKVDDGGIAGPSIDFATRVVDFASHPPFAIHRDDPSPPAGGHGVHKVAARSSAPGGAPWVDKAAIHFNHHVHLTSPQVLLPATDGRAARALLCADCHQPDSAGEAMSPIRFEQHCAACHQDQLQFDPGPFAGQVDSQLPHRDVEIVRGVIRQRLSEALLAKLPADQRPDDAVPPDGQAQQSSATDGDAIDRFFQRRLKPPAAPADRDWQAIEAAVRSVEAVLFLPSDRPAVNGKPVHGRGCAYCHQVEFDPAAPEPVRIVPPEVPSRWLRHARFNHAAHRMLDCLACHGQAMDEQQGQATATIMLPRIDTCQACHTGPGRGARNDCVQCHWYHPRPRQPADQFHGMLGLEQFAR
jgi:hypothetical protein